MYLDTDGTSIILAPRAFLVIIICCPSIDLILLDQELGGTRIAQLKLLTGTVSAKRLFNFK